MPNNKPPVLSHIEDIKKQIEELRGDISILVKFVQKYEEDRLKKNEGEIVETPEIPFKEISQSQQSAQKGWFW